MIYAAETTHSNRERKLVQPLEGSPERLRHHLRRPHQRRTTLLIVPVVLGQGTRLFPDAGPDIALDLVDSRADSKGVTIQVYRPAGRPQYATT